MFIAIPLENKPSWRSPPWMTVLLIAVNCLIFWGWQAPEETAVEGAGARYAQTMLPTIELPLFLTHLKQQAAQGNTRYERNIVQAAEGLYKRKAYAQLYALMWQEKNSASSYWMGCSSRPAIHVMPNGRKRGTPLPRKSPAAVLPSAGP